MTFVAIALVLAIAVIAVSALRWGAFLRPLGLELERGRLFRMTFVGTFFNAFLPTGVGGDAYKALRLRRGSGSLARPFASVLLDRLAGLVGLAVLGLGGACLRLADGDRDRVLFVALALGCALLATIALFLAFGERLARDDRGTGSGGRRAWVTLGRTLSLAARVGRQPHPAFAGLVGGILAQGLALVEVVLLARSLRLDIPAPALATILLTSGIAAAIPLSINGLGFREGAIVLGLGGYGISHDQALALALLVLGMLLASSAAGGIVYVVAGGDIPRAKATGSVREAAET